MALFDKLKESNFSLKGQQGPTFESDGQANSSIHAVAKNNQLVSSQDLISGRTYGLAPNQTKIAPSRLDLSGETPQQYLNMLGSSNSTAAATFNASANSGFTLEKRLAFSKLGLEGKTQPTFENVSQMSTSDIQAKASNNILQSSQDLLTGRRYGKGRFTVFVPASQLDGNGLPIGDVYKNKGPKEGRY